MMWSQDATLALVYMEVPGCHPEAWKRDSEAFPLEWGGQGGARVPLWHQGKGDLKLLWHRGWGSEAPADTNIFYHIEGSQQALKVVFYLDSYHFSKLPSCLESRASL